jgi:pyrroloquinoline quinone biosynthesis protein D
MTKGRPIRAKSAVWRRVGDEVVVIRGDGLSTHILNTTAALVWEMCDGEHSIAEMASMLATRFDVSPEVAQADIEEVNDRLVQAGIMDWSEMAGN